MILFMLSFHPKQKHGHPAIHPLPGNGLLLGTTGLMFLSATANDRIWFDLGQDGSTRELIPEQCYTAVN